MPNPSHVTVRESGHGADEPKHDKDTKPEKGQDLPEQTELKVLKSSVWETIIHSKIANQIHHLRFDPRAEATTPAEADAKEDPEDQDDSEQVEADEAAAAKHANIAVAARDGDLAAVRGHLRRDRRCLDRLFEVLGTRGAALHWAAANDCTAVVAFLLAKGAAVDVVASGGLTPLHYTAYNGQVESAKLLLAAKASVDIKNNFGKTPLDFARDRGRTEIVNLMTGNA